jgi:hypothetical protein
MSQNESWKERFAFVTGVIMVYGLLILSLWTKLAHFQVGKNLHIWTTNLPQEGTNTNITIFNIGTLLFSIAFMAIVLSLIHIISRGIYLAISSDFEMKPVLTVFERLDMQTFNSIFLLCAFWVFSLIFLSLFFLGAIIEYLLISLFSISLSTAGWISRSSIIIIIVIFAIWFVIKLGVFKKVRNRNTALTTNRLKVLARYFSKTFVISMICTFIIWMVAIEFCYTLELSLPSSSYSQSNNELIMINATLGGSTSDLKDAKLNLYDSNNVLVNSFSLNTIGNGDYISYIEPNSLKAGLYYIILEYPHVSLRASVPFISSKKSITKWFVIYQ